MYKSIIKPPLVLALISAVIALLLSLTYNLAGIGELGKTIPQEQLKEIMPLVMPSATELVYKKVSLEDTKLLGVYSDNGGSGTVIHMLGDGYAGKGTMKLMVGFDKDGNVTGVHVLENGETPQVGTKALTPEFLSQFIGKSGELTAAKDSSGDIDAVAGATVTSKSITKSVSTAYTLYEAVKGEVQ